MIPILSLAKLLSEDDWQEQLEELRAKLRETHPSHHDAHEKEEALLRQARNLQERYGPETAHVFLSAARGEDGQGDTKGPDGIQKLMACGHG